MIRFASLGSGSKGNALLVQSGRTRLLVDCGFGPRILRQRLSRLGVVPEQLDAVFVTHEHSDHVGGLAALAGRHSLPVFMSAGTYRALRRRGIALPDVRTLADGQAQVLDDVEVQPYAVPHDADEPLQYVIRGHGRALGVLTDAGHVTDAMARTLAQCDGLAIEFNHDAQLLDAGPYPAWLKRRIAGPHGHLDNAAAAGLLARLDPARLRVVLAAHLSETNNCPARVAALLRAGVGAAGVAWQIASQQGGSDWMRLGDE